MWIHDLHFWHRWVSFSPVVREGSSSRVLCALPRQQPVQDRHTLSAAGAVARRSYSGCLATVASLFQSCLSHHFLHHWCDWLSPSNVAVTSISLLSDPRGIGLFGHWWSQFGLSCSSRTWTDEQFSKFSLIKFLIILSVNKKKGGGEGTYNFKLVFLKFNTNNLQDNMHLQAKFNYPYRWCYRINVFVIFY